MPPTKRMVHFVRKSGLERHRVLLKYAQTTLWAFDYFKSLIKFKADKRKYKAMNTRKEFNINEFKLFPLLDDWNSSAGALSTYFYQDLWAAKKIHSSGVKNHFDIGSRVDGFILSLLAFTKVTLIDIRRLEINVDGLEFLQADATNLENIPDGSIMSLSALCSLEHFGLGRYGDPVDPEACFKAFKAIQRVIGGGGKVYISVPIAKNNSLEFNAHRIFSPETIIKEFNQMELCEFTVVKHDGRLISNALEDISWHIDSMYDDFGLFEFKKK